MTEFLRNEKLEFATAIPTINRRIKLMRCAVLSAFYDQSVFSWHITNLGPHRSLRLTLWLPC